MNNTVVITFILANVFDSSFNVSTVDSRNIEKGDSTKTMFISLDPRRNPNIKYQGCISRSTANPVLKRTCVSNSFSPVTKRYRFDPSDPKRSHSPQTADSGNITLISAQQLTYVDKSRDSLGVEVPAQDERGVCVPNRSLSPHVIEPTATIAISDPQMYDFNRLNDTVINEISAQENIDPETEQKRMLSPQMTEPTSETSVSSKKNQLIENNNPLSDILPSEVAALEYYDPAHLVLADENIVDSIPHQFPQFLLNMQIDEDNQSYSSVDTVSDNGIDEIDEGMNFEQYVGIKSAKLKITDDIQLGTEVIEVSNLADNPLPEQCEGNNHQISMDIFGSQAAISESIGFIIDTTGDPQINGHGIKVSEKEIGYEAYKTPRDHCHIQSIPIVNDAEFLTDPVLQDATVGVSVGCDSFFIDTVGDPPHIEFESIKALIDIENGSKVPKEIRYVADSMSREQCQTQYSAILTDEYFPAGLISQAAIIGDSAERDPVESKPFRDSDRQSNEEGGNMLADKLVLESSILDLKHSSMSSNPYVLKDMEMHLPKLSEMTEAVFKESLHSEIRNTSTSDAIAPEVITILDDEYDEKTNNLVSDSVRKRKIVQIPGPNFGLQHNRITRFFKKVTGSIIISSDEEDINVVSSPIRKKSKAQVNGGSSSDSQNPKMVKSEALDFEIANISKITEISKKAAPENDLNDREPLSELLTENLRTSKILDYHSEVIMAPLSKPGDNIIGTTIDESQTPKSLIFEGLHARGVIGTRVSSSSLFDAIQERESIECIILGPLSLGFKRNDANQVNFQIEIDISPHSQRLQVFILEKVNDGTLSNECGCNIGIAGDFNSGFRLIIVCESASKIELAKKIVENHLTLEKSRFNHTNKTKPESSNCKEPAQLNRLSGDKEYEAVQKKRKTSFFADSVPSFEPRLFIDDPIELALFEACNNQDVIMMMSLVNTKANICALNEYQQHPMHVWLDATAKEVPTKMTVRTCMLLCDSKWDKNEILNTMDVFLCTPLSIAITRDVWDWSCKKGKSCRGF